MLDSRSFLYQHNLQTVQTVVLLIYAMNHANISSWALLGMTYNIAVRIGCHVDPSRLGLGVVEGEERRRCRAALMMLYTVQNTCLGNITPQNITAEVELPADIDDDKVTASHLEGVDAVEATRSPSKMSYILYRFRLYNIAADICQCAIDEQLADPRTIMALDQRLAKENQEHGSRFSSQNLPLYHIAHYYILQSYTHHLYHVLHRASLNSRDSDGFTVQSQQRCKDSAITILEAHRCLYDTAEFRPYLWYLNGLGSFHAFLALSILIVLANNSNPGKDDVRRLHELIEQSLRHFGRMAARSDVCAKAVAILQRVLGNPTPTRIIPSSVATSESNVLQAGSLYQLPISPTSDSEQNPMITCNWAYNPELEALLFDMAPQQWMAPKSFTWDQWNHTVLI